MNVCAVVIVLDECRRSIKIESRFTCKFMVFLTYSAARKAMLSSFSILFFFIDIFEFTVTVSYVWEKNQSSFGQIECNSELIAYQLRKLKTEVECHI